jgi:hypothetical protein
MGAGESQILTQKLHQQCARIDIAGDGIAVHDHRDFGHMHSLGRTAIAWLRVIKIIPKGIL